MSVAKEASAAAKEVSATRRTTGDDLYRRSTQYRVWSFTTEGLVAAREAVHARQTELAKQRMTEAKTAIAEAQEAPSAAADVLNATEADPPTLEEEQRFLAYYGKSLLNTGDFFRMPTQVKATAVSFFKKFFLVHSIMEFNPKSVLYTCLFLAAKSENYFMSIASFASKLPKTEPSDVLDLEFTVLQSLRFTLYVHHPFRPLYGFFLDMQAVLLYPSPTMYDVNVDTLGALYDRAKGWLVEHALLSDVEFMYTPPQIALAALYDSDVRITDRYLKKKFGKVAAVTPAAAGAGATAAAAGTAEPAPAAAESEPASAGETEYDQLVRVVRRCVRRAKEARIPTKEESTEIDKKRFFALHPERLLKKKLKSAQ
ncbi:Cyclin-like domain-containing protein [[Candida] zeylanoides]